MKDKYKSKLDEYEVIPEEKPSVFTNKGKLIYTSQLLIDFRNIFCGDMKVSEIAEEISKHSELSESKIHEAIESIITQGRLTLAQYE